VPDVPGGREVSDDTFRAGRWRRYPFGHPPVRRDKLMSDRERVSDERLRGLVQTSPRWIPSVRLTASLAAELLDARDRIARAVEVVRSLKHVHDGRCLPCHLLAIMSGESDA
jgi:hypothetical protein